MTPDIKKLRKRFGYPQGYLARQIGVSRPTFIQIEKGERELTVSEAQKLADLFNLPLLDFLEGYESAPDAEVKIIKSSKKSRTKPPLQVKVPEDKIAKFKELLLYILSKIGAQPNIGETAIYKLLYFIDFDYYERYGEKLIGATYIKNHYGPTPVEFKKVVETMEKAGELEKVRSRYFQYRQKKYLPLRKPDINTFTAREIKMIDKTLNKLAEKNAKELSQYSHKDAPWEIAKEGEVIDYDFVYERSAPYACRDYDRIWQEDFLIDSERMLPPLTKEEIEYYERIVKENRMR